MKGKKNPCYSIGEKLKMEVEKDQVWLLLGNSLPRFGWMAFSIFLLAHCDITQLSGLAYVDHTVTVDLTKQIR